MADNSPIPIAQPPSHEQPDITSNSKTKTKELSGWQIFHNAFIKYQPLDKDHHELYQTYKPLAESIKITIQMVIGCILGIVVALDGILFLCSAFSAPSAHWLTYLNPLNIIAYGLFFSTGVDLAYMLFTPGPDEAIDPVMTGLAAAILLGIGKIDFSTIQLEQGVSLFLAAAALAALFATKKYLFHPLKEDKNDTNNQTQLAKKENEIAK